MQKITSKEQVKKIFMYLLILTIPTLTDTGVIDSNFIPSSSSCFSLSQADIVKVRVTIQTFPCRAITGIRACNIITAIAASSFICVTFIDICLKIFPKKTNEKEFIIDQHTSLGRQKSLDIGNEQ